MALPKYTTLTLSCDINEENSGPTIVHSTGVENYRIHPRLIQILQETFTNGRLCDHEQGVQCTAPPVDVIQSFYEAGFTVTVSALSDDRQFWILTKTS